jgi:DNA-binding MarR family transcriptional regulator/predicted N-acetyltransferase YhbS
VGSEHGRVEAIRRFTRFYTRHLGLLDEVLLRSPFSLAEGRLVYELAHHERTTATHLSQELAMDPGFVSRVVQRLEARGLVERSPSATDARQQLLSLTAAGQAAFAELNAASREQVGALLARLPDADQRTLVDAMDTIRALLGDGPEHRVPYILRPPHAGDLGWVVQRHGELYAAEHGWGEAFEGLVAQVVADYVRAHDGRRDRCWIAEREGENVGSVFLVHHPERPGVARLRLLLVEPRARGLGIGRRLVQECTRFARTAGYERITLWTNDVLHAARAIYEREGYLLVASEPHDNFGEGLVGETWEKEL